MLFDRKIKRSEAIYCTLCGDARCEKACPVQLPAKAIRGIWFDNSRYTASNLPNDNPCINCSAPCEKACVRSGKVPIKKLITKLYTDVKPNLEVQAPTNNNKLKTDICGIPLEHPFMLSSSVVSSTYDMCARAFEAGWAGVSFKTVCSLDIQDPSPRFSAIKGSSGEIVGFKNIEQLSDHSVEENMEIFRKLKKNYPSKFLLVSIMGKDEAEWEELAMLCEQNGADAVELNFSCPNMTEEGLGSDIGQIPNLVELYTRAAKRSCSIPVLAKLTPNVASMIPAGEAAKRGGADGISAINTIKSITGVNPHTFISEPSVHGMSAFGGYSGNAVKPIALKFISELANDSNLSGIHLSGMGGIETWQNALEFILLGCKSVQVTTAVLQYGYRIIEELTSGLNYYLEEKGFESVKDVVGLALDTVSNTTDVLERDTIIFPKFDHTKCIGCHRCFISCTDGGHSAIVIGDNDKPKLNGSKCVGCHLCRIVCPEQAIRPSSKRIRRNY